MVIAMLLTASKADAQTLKLLQQKSFAQYSSASAIAWHRGSLYVMGDDAPTLLVLNKKLKEKRQVAVFNYSGQRIPYAVKPDLESAAIISQGNSTTLWLFPSFSSPTRNKVVRLDIGRSGAHPTVLTLAPFTTGLPATNIEGAEVINHKLLLANRAHSGAPGHYLLSYDLDRQVLPAKPEITYTIQLPATKEVVGISGMFYLAKKDWLLLTISTEVAATATRDGNIGPSYLAFIRDATKQMAAGTTLTADTLMPLDPVLNSGAPMKIESVTAMHIRKRKVVLVLAADNDNGTTNLFRVSARLPR